MSLNLIIVVRPSIQVIREAIRDALKLKMLMKKMGVPVVGVAVENGSKESVPPGVIEDALNLNLVSYQVIKTTDMSKPV